MKYLYNHEYLKRREDSAIANKEVQELLLTKLIEQYEAQIASQKATIESLNRNDEELNATVASLQDTVAGLREIIASLNRKLFGTSSEKTSHQNSSTTEPASSDATEEKTIRED